MAYTESGQCRPTLQDTRPSFERPRRSRKGSKKTAVEIKPPVQDGINNPVVVRQSSNVQMISGKFHGDFQRHYDGRRADRRRGPAGETRPRGSTYDCSGMGPGTGNHKATYYQ